MNTKIEINLREILKANGSIWNNNIEVEDAIAAMREACELTIDQCRKNAEVMHAYKHDCEGFMYEDEIVINEESIANTKLQLKDE